MPTSTSTARFDWWQVPQGFEIRPLNPVAALSEGPVGKYLRITLILHPDSICLTGFTNLPPTDGRTDWSQNLVVPEHTLSTITMNDNHRTLFFQHVDERQQLYIDRLAEAVAYVPGC